MWLAQINQEATQSRGQEGDQARGAERVISPGGQRGVISLDEAGMGDQPR